MIKVISIIGTRPEAIKMALLHKQLLEDSKFNAKLCCTGQHETLLFDVLENFEIKADFIFHSMKYNSSMAAQLAYMLKELQTLVDAEAPELIIVQGDTLSAYCGSVIAFFNKIKLVHVEAGLRTDNKWGPFPEEINRRYIDMVSDLHCAPTKDAKQNLLKENVSSASIIVTGNTGIDALKYIIAAKPNSDNKLFIDITHHRKNGFKIGLLTMHRRESNPETMRDMLTQIELSAEENKLIIYFPLHPNPLFEKVFSEFDNSKFIITTKPQSYLDFVHFMNTADIILTDSGGIQEEAPSLGKPIIVLRNETERQELLDNYPAKLYDAKRLSSYIKTFLNQNISATDIFGNGKASEKIVKEIKQRLIS